MGQPALAGVTVSAQQGGKVLRATALDPVGKFTLAFLGPAQAPSDVVFAAAGRTTAVIAGVPLGTIATRTETLSTSAAPIALPPATLSRDAAGAVTLDPATGTTEATLRALQAAGSVAAVEVGFANGNSSGG